MDDKRFDKLIGDKLNELQPEFNEAGLVDFNQRLDQFNRPSGGLGNHRRKYAGWLWGIAVVFLLLNGYMYFNLIQARKDIEAVKQELNSAQMLSSAVISKEAQFEAEKATNHNSSNQELKTNKPATNEATNQLGEQETDPKNKREAEIAKVTSVIEMTKEASLEQSNAAVLKVNDSKGQMATSAVKHNKIAIEKLSKEHDHIAPELRELTTKEINKPRKVIEIVNQTVRLKDDNSLKGSTTGSKKLNDGLGKVSSDPKVSAVEESNASKVIENNIVEEETVESIDPTTEAVVNKAEEKVDQKKHSSADVLEKLASEELATEELASEELAKEELATEESATEKTTLNPQKIEAPVKKWANYSKGWQLGLNGFSYMAIIYNASNTINFSYGGYAERRISKHWAFGIGGYYSHIHYQPKHLGENLAFSESFETNYQPEGALSEIQTESNLLEIPLYGRYFYNPQNRFSIYSEAGMTPLVMWGQSYNYIIPSINNDSSLRSLEDVSNNSVNSSNQSADIHHNSQVSVNTSDVFIGSGLEVNLWKGLGAQVGIRYHFSPFSSLGLEGSNLHRIGINYGFRYRF